MLAYYHNVHSRVYNMPTRSTIAKSVLSFFALMVISVSMLLTFVNNTSYAMAEEKTPEEVLSEAMDKYGTSQEEITKKFAEDQKNGNIDRNSFGYVLQRMFVPGYMNETTLGVAGEGQESRQYNCDVNNNNAGTALYHNCDIPNVMAEFIQTTVSSFTPNGMMNAQADYAKIDNAWFGLPSAIPAGEVPADPNQRVNKYTGLELYGYGFKYTSYNGEYDNIRVMSEARMLSNFGGSQAFTLGVKTIVNGVAGGTQKATENFTNNISNGQVLTAFSSAYEGFFEGSTSASVNTILDTSDLSVFNSMGWYRDDFGETTYGFRELSDEELAKNQLSYLQEFLTGKSNELKLPQEFSSLETLPARPAEQVASCIAKVDGEEHQLNSIGDNKVSTENDCKNLANEKYKTTSVDFSPDGLQKSQTLKDWKESNKSWFDKAEKYGFKVSIDVSNEDNREQKLIAFYEKAKSEYDRLATEQSDKIRAESGKEWVDKTLTGESMKDLLAQASSSNMLSPYARFVCVKPDGTDMKIEGRLVFAFAPDGTINNQCSQKMRSPIQNGIFGNGYVDGQEKPQVDTRRLPYGETTMGVPTLDKMVGGALSSFNLSVASFSTRMGNTLINLSFSSLTKTLGINDIVAKFIGDLRDGIFMPLVVIVVSASALFIFMDCVFRKKYMQGIQAVAYLAITYIIGAMILLNPTKFLNIVDTVPTQIEGAIATAIYTTGSASDDICSATGNVQAQSGEKQNLFTYGDNGVRTIMCENWRAYAYNTWTAGQFGTNFDNLYAVPTDGSNNLKNTNGDLVGQADVNMGANTIVKNWSLYQLDVMHIGTTTSIPENPGYKVGQTNPNMYRLVDMQAGVNNGAGTDSTYYEMWRGSEPMTRLVVSAIGGINSMVGFITIAIFTINKIVLQFVTILMLLALPFILLAGVFYHGGRQFLSQYGWTLLSVIVERIFHTVMIALMLRFVILVNDSIRNFILACIVSIAISIGFLMFRKKLRNMLRANFAPKTGSMSRSVLSMDASKMYQTVVPRSVRNGVHNVATETRDTTFGMVAGLMYTDGGAQDVARSMNRSRQDRRVKNFNEQRREGFGTFQEYMQASNIGIEDAKKSLREGSNVESVAHTKSDASHALQQAYDKQGVRKEYRQQQVKDIDVDLTPGSKTQKQSKSTIDKVASLVGRGSVKTNREQGSRNRAQDYRNLGKAVRAQERKETRLDQVVRRVDNSKLHDKAFEQPSFDAINQELEHVEKTGFSSRVMADRALKQYDRMVELTALRQAREAKAKQSQEDFAQSLKDMIHKK